RSRPVALASVVEVLQPAVGTTFRCNVTVLEGDDHQLSDRQHAAGRWRAHPHGYDAAAWGSGAAPDAQRRAGVRDAQGSRTTGHRASQAVREQSQRMRGVYRGLLRVT